MQFERRGRSKGWLRGENGRGGNRKTVAVGMPVTRRLPHRRATGLNRSNRRVRALSPNPPDPPPTPPPNSPVPELPRTPSNSVLVGLVLFVGCHDALVSLWTGAARYAPTCECDSTLHAQERGPGKVPGPRYKLRRMERQKPQVCSSCATLWKAPGPRYKFALG